MTKLSDIIPCGTKLIEMYAHLYPNPVLYYDQKDTDTDRFKLIFSFHTDVP